MDYDHVDKYEVMEDAAVDAPESFKPMMKHAVDLALDELVREKRLEYLGQGRVRVPEAKPN